MSLKDFKKLKPFGEISKGLSCIITKDQLLAKNALETMTREMNLRTYWRKTKKDQI